MPKAVRSRKRLSGGLFISFEGSDGTGKSTQIRRVGARLRKLGYEVVGLREPGSTLLGEKLRRLLQFDRSIRGLSPVAETLMFCASRAQLVAEKIAPALAAGQVVLTDRFSDSTTVYQGFGRRLDVPSIERIHEFSTNGCRPNITFVLMMNPRRSLKRARNTSKRYDRMESQKKTFYEAINRGYRQLARKQPRRVKLIAADRPRDDVFEDIWRLVAQKLR